MVGYAGRTGRTADGPLQILVANLDYSDYLGRLAIARVFNGTLKQADEASIAKLDGSFQKTKITKLFSFSGLKRVDIDQTVLGDIVAVAGIEDIGIGDTTIDGREHGVELSGSRARLRAWARGKLSDQDLASAARTPAE